MKNVQSESGKLRVACYSDLHGQLPEVVDCDIAVIAGDLCPDGEWTRQIAFLQGPFSEWLKNFKYSVFTAGNHDHVMETSPELVPRFPWNTRYLWDRRFDPGHPMSGWMWDRRLGIYGTPYSLPYGRWHFMKDEDGIRESLKGAGGVDILVSHGPPYGYGDQAPRYDEFGKLKGYENAGSWALREHVDQYQPKLVVVGHIHEGRGVYKCGKTTVVNAAVTGFARDEYDRVRKFLSHPPVVVEI